MRTALGHTGVRARLRVPRVRRRMHMTCLPELYNSVMSACTLYCACTRLTRNEHRSVGGRHTLYARYTPRCRGVIHVCCGVVDTLPKKEKIAAAPARPLDRADARCPPLPPPSPLPVLTHFHRAAAAAPHRIAYPLRLHIAWYQADLRARGAGRPPSQLPPALCPIRALGSAAFER